MNRAKALSVQRIRQLYQLYVSTLILIGPNFRGKFLIHASKNVTKKKCESLNLDYTKLRVGVILGRAILYDIKMYDNKTQFTRDQKRHYADANFFDSYMYGFMVKNASLPASMQKGLNEYWKNKPLDEVMGDFLDDYANIGIRNTRL